jgi:Fic family protein
MPKSMTGRSGRYVNQPTGYKAFIPSPLPPDPPLRTDDEIMALLGDAALALGRLDGLAVNLPNPDLFVSMYVRKEAVLSSQIEGTQATLDDVLAFEVEAAKEGIPADAAEVVNYVRAMSYGNRRLQTLPLSLRLIREIHRELMHGVRGSERLPGEFRTSQNWIGAPGSTLADAAFGPPPPHEMTRALGDLEKFLHADSPLPLLIRCALTHAQFETIHPFLDGNGRVGRLLITFMLCHGGVLARPLLYLSYYFKANRNEYYDRLNRIRFEGDWESWVRFFLRGVADVAKQAAETAMKILDLRARCDEKLRRAKIRGTATALRLLDQLFEHPVTTAATVGAWLDVSKPTANDLLATFEKAGLLRETTGLTRGRVFAFEPYLKLLRAGTEPERRTADNRATRQTGRLMRTVTHAKRGRRDRTKGA